MNFSAHECLSFLPCGLVLWINLFTRFFLSLVVLVSGIGKLMDPAAGRQAMVDFGVPARWAEQAAYLLPLVEIALGLGIIIDSTSRLAGLGLAALFAVFSIGIINLLRQDKAPPCNCFGAVHSEPVSGWTLLRSLSLSGLSAAAYGLPVWPLTPGLKEVALAGTAYMSCGTALTGLWKWHLKRDVDKGPRRLGVGELLPTVRLADGRWLSEALSSVGPTLVLLTSEGCLPCEALKQAMSSWRHRIQGELPIIELRRGKKSGEDRDSKAYNLDPTTFGRFLSSTPAGILVGPNGGVLQPPAVGPAEVEALIKLTLESIFPRHPMARSHEVSGQHPGAL